MSGAGTASGFTVNNIGSVPTVSLTGTGAATTLNFDAAALAGTNTLDLTLENVTGGLLTVSRNVSGALETIKITSDGATANVLGGLTANSLGATTLNVSGPAGMTLGAIADSGNTLKTINASGLLTGAALSVTALASSTVTGGAGNDTITTNGGGLNSVTGGSGTDTLVFSAGLGVNDTIIGGDGTDQLRVATGAVNAGTIYTNISGMEGVELSTALTGTVTLANTQAGLQSVTLRAGGSTVATADATSTGTIVFDGTLTPSAYTVNIGANGATSTSQSRTQLGNTLTVQVSGTGTSDAVTVNGLTFEADSIGGAAQEAQNVFNGQGITARGVETLTLSTSQTVRGGAAAAVGQTVGAVNMVPTGTTSTTLNISGNNTLTVVDNVAITADKIDASGLSTNVSGNASALIMWDATGTSGTTTATTVIGSAGSDTLFTNLTTSSSVDGGAGNDNITGGTGNDTLLGGAGNDSINGSSGNDSIDGGAGNDTVTIAAGNINSSDVIKGGDGVDSLTITGMSAAISATNLAGISEFEILDVTATGGFTQAMSDFANNSGFTEIRVNAAGNSVGFSNVGSNTNTLGLTGLTGTTGTVTFARLVDVATNELTVQSRVDNVNLTGLSVVNEETLTFNTSLTLANNTVEDYATTIGTLTADDVKSLTVNGGGNFVITNPIGNAQALATIDLSDTTGTMNINASTSLVNMTVTNGTGAMTIVAGSGNDSITGSEVADNLSGGRGADTLTGNGGDDTLVGGYGADSIVGGVGTNTYSGGDIATGAGNFDNGSIQIDGQVINLGATAITTLSGTLAFSSGLASVGSNQAVYLNATSGAGLSSNVDTLSQIQNVIGTGGTDWIVGSSGNNNLAGDAGADTINGGAGDDTITGGLAADSLTGGTGADTFVFTSTATTDTIADFTVAQTDVLTIDVSSVSTALVDMAGTALTAGAVGDVLAVSGTATNTIASSTANVLLLSSTFASVGAVETAIETGGAAAFTFAAGATVDDGDTFAIVWQDTAGASHLSVFAATTVAAGGGLTDATLVSTLADLSGVQISATAADANFNFIA